MITLIEEAPRAQSPLSTHAYDHWMTPEGEVKAEFHKMVEGFLIRFPDEADFQIDETCERVTAWPASDQNIELTRDLYRNAILPVIANHRGGLCLHGSAVVVGDCAIGFVGQSRSGKTTLAGAFAKAGDSFLAEDAIELVRNSSVYHVQPKEPILRLFDDSARFLLEQLPVDCQGHGKRVVRAPERLPFCIEAMPLHALMILGDGEPDGVMLDRLGPQAALSSLLQHSFILDVEDKARLKAHFSRLADLSQETACYRLEYTREYSELSAVIEAVRAIRWEPHQSHAT